ncbi:flagellar protein FlbD [Clostridia bacterium]|nr:flagellar protein FlbD [Clostridia bacterium]
MIILTKLDGKRMLLNEAVIETAIETPDTVIKMVNGNTFIVTESLDDIVSLSAEYRKNSRRSPRTPDLQQL